MQWANHIGRWLPSPRLSGEWQVATAAQVCVAKNFHGHSRLPKCFCYSWYILCFLFFIFLLRVLMFFAHKLLAFLNLSQQFVCWSARQPVQDNGLSTWNYAPVNCTCYCCCCCCFRCRGGCWNCTRWRLLVGSIIKCATFCVLQPHESLITNCIWNDAVHHWPAAELHLAVHLTWGIIKLAATFKCSPTQPGELT